MSINARGGRALLSGTDAGTLFDTASDCVVSMGTGRQESRATGIDMDFLSETAPVTSCLAERAEEADPDQNQSRQGRACSLAIAEAWRTAAFDCVAHSNRKRRSVAGHRFRLHRA